jgi:hypothetical protein
MEISLIILAELSDYLGKLKEINSASNGYVIKELI